MFFYFLIIVLSWIWIVIPSFSSVQSDLNRVAKDCRQSEREVAQLESQLQDVKSIYYIKTEHLLLQQKKIARLILLLKTLQTEAPSRILQADEDSKYVLRNFSILQCYIRHLHKHIQKLRTELSTLKQTKEETTARKEALNEKLSIYQKKYAHLEHLLKQNKAQIQKTLSERKEKEEKAKQLAERSPNLTALVKQLEKEQPPSKQKSAAEDFSLLSPVQGPILTHFNQKSSHSPDGSGVVFKGRLGSHVLAPISGKVLYAGTFRRYNKIVIIGFRKTYSLLLTGLDRLDVSVGQEVKVGDPLGRLAEEATQNPLYLELRNHGIPINPHLMKL